MSSKDLKLIKHAILFYAYLFVVWGFYRLLFQAPEPYDELILKPLVWLVPLYLLAKREKASLKTLGITFKGFFSVVYFVLALGFVFSLLALVVNSLKYGGANFAADIGNLSLMSALGVSLVTAVSEELSFRGYILSRIIPAFKSEWSMNIILSIGWTLIHLPIAIFDWRLGAFPLVIYTVVVFTFSLGTTFVYLRTKNIIAPILLHLLWQWPIILFR
jgi:hypothetical protein